MRYRIAPYGAAAFSLFAILVSGCGGGGAGAARTPVLPSAPIPQSNGGPVGYMQNSGSSSSGTIFAGTSNAIVAIMSGDAQAHAGFSTDSFVVNAAASTQSITRTAQAQRAIARVPSPELFPADDRALLGELARHAVNAPPASVRESASVHTLSAGAQAQVWVEQGYGSRVSNLIPATLVAQSTHGNIWVQSTLVSSLQPLASQLASEFENAYASDVQNFAAADYSSNAPGMRPQYTTCNGSGAKQGTGTAYIAEPGDRRIDVMVVDSSQIGGLGGYFTGANLMTQGALNCLNGGYRSNQAPFIFVGWSPSFGTDYEIREDYVRSTAHELQHLINFVNHSILAPGASNATFNGNEMQYLNEGLSMLAQDFAVQRLYGAQGLQFDAADALPRAAAYLSSPSDYSISSFSGIDKAWGSTTPQNNCSGGCYGGAYLLARYLRDRFGASFAHTIETSGTTGIANLQVATGEPAGELFGDFALAMAADTLGVSAAPRFRFGSLSLSGKYVDQFGNAHQLGGLELTGASGSSMTVTAPVGGFAFVAVPSVPAAGMNVQVSDRALVGGFSLLGGLAQH